MTDDWQLAELLAPSEYEAWCLENEDAEINRLLHEAANDD